MPRLQYYGVCVCFVTDSLSTAFVTSWWRICSSPIHWLLRPNISNKVMFVVLIFVVVTELVLHVHVLILCCCCWVEPNPYNCCFYAQWYFLHFFTYFIWKDVNSIPLTAPFPSTPLPSAPPSPAARGLPSRNMHTEYTASSRCPST